MRDWRTLLKADPTEWLMGSEDPALRRAVAVDLMGLPANSVQVLSDGEESTESGPIAKVLSKQEPGGNWGRPEDFYQKSKYKGTVWNLILLAELGALPKDPRVGRACDFICNWAQASSGGFTYKGGPWGGTKPSLPCLTANMVYSMTRLGFGKGPEVLQARDYIANVYGAEGREMYNCPACRSSKVKVLKALSWIPEKDRTEAEQTTASMLAETMLARCLPSDVVLTDPARPEWMKLGYPRMYETDILEMLDMLARLGVRDERMMPALDIMLSKQGDDGRWLMERSFNNRFLTSIEKDGKPSRWVTYRAMSTLMRLARLKQSL